MKILVASLALFVLVSCGTTSKKVINLPPLGPNVPVQMFYSKPNIKFDVVCEIEAKGNNSIGGGYTQKEDFEPMFKTEARKCGADGVIFGFMHGFRDGAVTAQATGIRILGQPAAVTDEKQMTAYSLAIQSHDLPKIRLLLEKVPKKRFDRAPTDDELVNLGLYIATLDGATCDKNVIQLLETEYEGRVTSFKPIQMSGGNKFDSDSPLCENVMARSLPRMEDKVSAVAAVNNHYVDLLNGADKKAVDQKAGRYLLLLEAAAKLIVESCQLSETDPVCAIKGSYMDFATRTKAVPLLAVKKNAKAVLGVFSSAK